MGSVQTHDAVAWLALASDAAHDPHDMLITMATAIAAGVMLIILAHRLHLPAIVLLLVGGVLLGPAIWGDAALVKPGTLGDGLGIVVAIAVGLILFEGGLTLDLDGYRSSPVMIKRLLSIGVVVTWMGTALVVWAIFRPRAEYAVLAASLVIVTGPTVIAPLLKRIQVLPKVHSILHWEGVLIDPIGVFIALMCFEYVVSDSGGAAFANLGIRVAAGLGFGVMGGLALTFMVKRKIVPEDLINVFTLGSAVTIFGLAELVQSEAGLLSVTVAGFVFGLSRSSKLKQVRQFKAEITDLLIGTLFILLSARLTFDQFQTFGLRGLLVVGLVMALVRPLSIFLCSLGIDLTIKERVFLSWVAPRGIVAASMASLVAISMVDEAEAQFVETFTYSVIIATIVVQGLTAGPFARLLGLKRPEPTGWLVVGANAFGRRIAKFIREIGELQVTIVDSNARLIREAQSEGFTAHVGDARDITLEERYEMQGLGNLLALTDNEDLNIRLCETWAELYGSDHVFRCNPTASDTPLEETADLAGQVVWPKLPRPSLIAGELQRNEAATLESTGSAPAFAHLASPLLAIMDGRVVLDPTLTGEAGAETRTLYLQRAADYLRRSLRPELVLTLDVKEMRELFEAIVARMVELFPTLPRQEIVDELIERETGFPTALGHGVAVPHAYSKSLDQRLCAIVRIPDGIPFGAHDNEDVRLVFLVLSPQGDPEGHLATLAEIARRVIDDDTRQRLMDAKTPIDVLRVVQETRVV